MNKEIENINWAIIFAIAYAITGVMIACFENNFNIFLVSLGIGIIFLIFGIIKEFLEEIEDER